MSSRWAVAFMEFCLLFTSGTIVAQTATSGTGTLRLQLLDSKNGVALQSAFIQIDGANVAGKADASGLVSLPGIANGQHSLHIEADDYQGLTTTVNVDGDFTLVQTIELDPMEPFREVDTETTPSQTEAVVRGNVVDDLRGVALPGAQITVREKGALSVSDSTGKYSLRFSSRTVKSPRGEILGGEHVTLNVAHEGYRTLEMQNVEVPPGSITTVSIRITKLEDAGDAGTSKPEVINEMANRGAQRNYDWVFDATLR